MLKSPNWYVICTRPRYEQKIATDIHQLSDYECYLPMQTVKKKYVDRVKTTRQPIFSNYLFVKSTNEQRSVLFGINGVLKFLCTEGKPVIVRESEIERIRLLERNSNGLQKEQYFAEGKEVEVERGVFAGLRGIVVKRMSKSRLLVRMPLLQQAVSVEIAEDDICVMN